MILPGYFSTQITLLLNPNHFISQTQSASFSTPTTLLLNSNQQRLCLLWVLVALAPKWWREKATRGLKVEDYPTARWSASKQPHNPGERSDNWQKSYQLRRKVFDFDLSKKCVGSPQVVKSSNLNKYNSCCCDILIVLLQSIYWIVFHCEGKINQKQDPKEKPSMPQFKGGNLIHTHKHKRRNWPRATNDIIIVTVPLIFKIFWKRQLKFIFFNFFKINRYIFLKLEFVLRYN